MQTRGIRMHLVQAGWPWAQPITSRSTMRVGHGTPLQILPSVRTPGTSVMPVITTMPQATSGIWVITTLPREQAWGLVAKDTSARFIPICRLRYAPAAIRREGRVILVLYLISQGDQLHG